MKMQIEQENEEECFWIVFVYFSTDVRERIRQWECLKERKQFWGEKWVMGEDFDEIKNNEGKR